MKAINSSIGAALPNGSIEVLSPHGHSDGASALGVSELRDHNPVGDASDAEDFAVALQSLVASSTRSEQSAAQTQMQDKAQNAAPHLFSRDVTDRSSADDTGIESQHELSKVSGKSAAVRVSGPVRRAAAGGFVPVNCTLGPQQPVYRDAIVGLSGGSTNEVSTRPSASAIPTPITQADMLPERPGIVADIPDALQSQKQNPLSPSLASAGDTSSLVANLTGPEAGGIGAMAHLPTDPANGLPSATIRASIGERIARATESPSNPDELPSQATISETLSAPTSRASNARTIQQNAASLTNRDARVSKPTVTTSSESPIARPHNDFAITRAEPGPQPESGTIPTESAKPSPLTLAPADGSPGKTNRQNEMPNPTTHQNLSVSLGEAVLIKSEPIQSMPHNPVATVRIDAPQVAVIPRDSRTAALKVDLGEGETVHARVQQQAAGIDVRIVAGSAPTAVHIVKEIDSLRHALEATGLMLHDAGVTYRGEGGDHPPYPDDRSAKDEQGAGGRALFTVQEISE